MFAFHKQAKSPRWRVIGASVQGAGHEKNAKPCEDAHRWKSFPGDILIGVVADGAGSASHAEKGSGTASKTALDLLETALEKNMPSSTEEWKALLLDTARQARAAIEQEAGRLKLRPRDLASTLVCSVATPDWFGAMQIGDGAVLAGEEDRLLVLTKPVVSEYLNETVFLTSPDYLERLQITVLPGRARRLAMFTDGLQMLALKMPLAQPHIPFFKPLFGLLEQTADAASAQVRLEEFLRSPRLRMRTDDDLTLLLASIQEGGK